MPGASLARIAHHLYPSIKTSISPLGRRCRRTVRPRARCRRWMTWYAYSSMQRAVIKERTAASQKEAEDLLDSVEIKENDFPWLADIRTLGKAEIAHRFSEPDVEKQRANEFMARQPMLFEPDIALNFHLLRYQERLKPRYQTK